MTEILKADYSEVLHVCFQTAFHFEQLVLHAIFTFSATRPTFGQIRSSAGAAALTNGLFSEIHKNLTGISIAIAHHYGNT
jgi:hypothetical protein